VKTTSKIRIPNNQIPTK